jgi:hypothetical protein
MTESRTYVTEDLWFPCDDCGKQITHHSIHTCSPQLLTMNPDILPTPKEWQLVCKMVKQQRELTDEEILEVCSQIEPFDDITIEQAFIEFARAILMKASEK